MERPASRKAVKIVRCPYCGAQFEEGLLRCPYCGSVDDHQDETEFLEDLDELKDKLEDLPEETIRQTNMVQRKEAVQDMGRILKRIGIIAVIALLIIGLGLFLDRVVEGNSPARRDQENRERYLWLQEHIPLLDEMYEKGDYEGLLEAYQSGNGAWYYEWEHYDLLEGLRLLERIRESDIPILEESVKTFGADSRQAAEDRSVLLADELQVLYFDKQARNKEDAATIRELSADVREDFEARFALTEEELEYLQKKMADNYGYISIRECREFLDKR